METVLKRYDSQSPEWLSVKKRFQDNGVWKWFTDLRKVSTAKCGHVDLGHIWAKYVVREWLDRKQNGEPVVLPEGVNPDDVGPGFVDLSRFRDSEADYRRDAMWVYMHLGADVDPESAPSSGAYFWLCELRENSDARRSFMINIMPKLMKDAEQNPMRDDGREQFEILKRLAAEDSAVGSDT